MLVYWRVTHTFFPDFPCFGFSSSPMGIPPPFRARCVRYSPIEATHAVEGQRTVTWKLGRNGILGGSRPQLRPGTDRPYRGVSKNTPLKTNISPEKWWLFLFRGHVSFRGCMGTPKSSILIRFSTIFTHLFWGKHPVLLETSIFSRGLRTIICYGIPWIREDFFPYMNDWWCFFW